MQNRSSSDARKSAKASLSKYPRAEGEVKGVTAECVVDRLVRNGKAYAETGSFMTDVSSSAEVVNVITRLTKNNVAVSSVIIGIIAIAKWICCSEHGTIRCKDLSTILKTTFAYFNNKQQELNFSRGKELAESIRPAIKKVRRSFKLLDKNHKSKPSPGEHEQEYRAEELVASIMTGLSDFLEVQGSMQNKARMQDDYITSETFVERFEKIGTDINDHLISLQNLFLPLKKKTENHSKRTKSSGKSKRKKDGSLKPSLGDHLSHKSEPSADLDKSSDGLSDSNESSDPDELHESDELSNSDNSSDSSDLSDLSDSDEINESDELSNSDLSSGSSDLSDSDELNESDELSNSDLSSGSSDLSDSDELNESDELSNSDISSGSSDLSDSDELNESDESRSSDESSDTSDSDESDESDEFSENATSGGSVFTKLRNSIKRLSLGRIALVKSDGRNMQVGWDKKDRPVFRGPRGGLYVFSETGRKMYVAEVHRKAA